MAKVITIPATRSRYTAAPISSREKRKVAGYARVSTDHEEQQTSYEAQVDYYTNYIKGREDWEFVSVYTDEGISATSTTKRSGFNQMVADALDGRIEIKLAYLIQRIGTEYLKSRRNKGFRHIGRDRKPFSFGGNFHFCKEQYLKVNPLHRYLNPPCQ